MQQEPEDAIFLNAQGLVCELTGDNLFIVKESRVLTPPLWVGLLDGITPGSNAAFDAMLRERDLESGVRDFEAVNALAESAGLELQADHAMPANNQLLVWG